MISRRSLLSSLTVIAASGGVSPLIARAARAVALSDHPANLRFSVFYQGTRIGAHSVSHSTATGQTRIATEISLSVKILLFTAFSFRHSSEETWQDGRLTSLWSETVEHGETIQVSGAATPQGFRITSRGKPFTVGSDTMTSNNLWTATVLQQAVVIDAHHGGVIGISARKLADEWIEVAGRRILATRYRLITPYIAGSIWYDDQGLWVHGEFEQDSAIIVYQLEL